MPKIIARLPTVTIVQEESPWEEQKVRICGKLISEGVRCLGSIAIHKGFMEDDKEKWTLTHLPTSLRIVWLSSEAEIMKIGEYLRAKFYLALKEETKEGAKSKVPPWVKPWLTLCRESDKYIEPEPFEREER